MKKTIFLIGMMGCGKSTLGKRLAAKLNVPFLDLDDDIVAFEGRSIPDIFADVGDAGFRICETAALRRACDGEPCVVATGGGIVTREENIELMRENGVVVWLNRPLDHIRADVRQDTRPNLAGDVEERLRTLMAVREPLYRKAAHAEYVNRMTLGVAVSELCELDEIKAIL